MNKKSSISSFVPKKKRWTLSVVWLVISFYACIFYLYTWLPPFLILFYKAHHTYWTHIVTLDGFWKGKLCTIFNWSVKSKGWHYLLVFRTTCIKGLLFWGIMWILFFFSIQFCEVSEPTIINKRFNNNWLDVKEKNFFKPCLHWWHARTYGLNMSNWTFVSKIWHFYCIFSKKSFGCITTPTKITTNNGDLVCFHGKKNTKKKQNFWVLEFMQTRHELQLK